MSDLTTEEKAVMFDTIRACFMERTKIVQKTDAELMRANAEIKKLDEKVAELVLGSEAVKTFVNAEVLPKE